MAAVRVVRDGEPSGRICSRTIPCATCYPRPPGTNPHLVRIPAISDPYSIRGISHHLSLSAEPPAISRRRRPNHPPRCFGGVRNPFRTGCICPISGGGVSKPSVYQTMPNGFIDIFLPF